MDKLRDESMAAQQGRLDLVKWKVIAIGGLGAAALGLGEDWKAQPVLLALVPLLCVYVDLAYWNLSIRMIAIGQYLRGDVEGPYAKYETFVASSYFVFGFEDAAMLLLTGAVCFGVVPVACATSSLGAEKLILQVAAYGGFAIEVIGAFLYGGAVIWLSRRRLRAAAGSRARSAPPAAS